MPTVVVTFNVPNRPEDTIPVKIVQVSVDASDSSWSAIDLTQALLGRIEPAIALPLSGAMSHFERSPIEKLGLPTDIVNILRRPESEGGLCIRIIGELLVWTPFDLLRVSGIGKGRLVVIRETLKKYGLHLKSEGD